MFGKLFHRKSSSEYIENTNSITPLKILLSEQEENGLGKLYPIIKPANWVAKSHAVCIPWIGGEENPQVLITYGWDAKENLTFLTNQKAAGLNRSEVHEQAIGNIGQLNIPISTTVVDDHTIITASGHDFSAEKILDTKFLLEVSSVLDANELLVSIPRRRCFMACDQNSEDLFLQKFQALHDHAWNDDSYGNAPIANGIFEIKKGSVVGYIPL